MVLARLCAGIKAVDWHKLLRFAVRSGKSRPIQSHTAAQHGGAEHFYGWIQLISPPHATHFHSFKKERR